VTTVPAPAVVVGLDATEASAAALAWAAAEARAHHAPLVVVHALDPRGRNAVYSPSGPEGSGRRGHDADDVLGRLKALIERAAAGQDAPVEQVFEIGVPAQVLIGKARGARMLVLGHGERHRRRDMGHAPGPALGSIARACVARAECPVVVVPEAWARRGAPAGAQSKQHAPVVGGRAIYPFQGRIPLAHH
jgi:nucleotide-binding universal stress UspA family protein